MELIDAYVRVSRVAGREGPSYISPSVQRDRITRWADYKGVRIAVWHVDEDQSGGAASRPGLDAAVARALSGQTAGIVAASIDRFSRLTEQGVRDLRRLNEAGARLVFVQEDIDATGPMGKFVYVVMLAMAEYFLDQIKASWVVAKERALERGAHIGRTPLGYQRGDDGTLSPSDDASTVVEVFRLAATGDLGAATDRLRQGWPDRGWSSSHTRRLLANRVYLGEVNYGAIRQTDAHEPLVSRGIWEAAQTVPRAYASSANYPLSGVLRCGTCGGAMIGGRGGKKQRTYRCANTLSQVRSVKCDRGPVVLADRIEEYLLRESRRLLGELTGVVSEPETDKLALLERALVDAEGELDGFASDLEARRLLADRYHAALQARVEAVEDAGRAYREAAQNAPLHLELGLLDDPGMLPTVLRGMFSLVRVLPGRGRIEDRVDVTLHSDESSGVASA